MGRVTRTEAISEEQGSADAPLTCDGQTSDHLEKRIQKSDCDEEAGDEEEENTNEEALMSDDKVRSEVKLGRRGEDGYDE